MSFPRAAIKRFNEAADSTIPAPGAYDPKFSTDVAVASSQKGSGLLQWNHSSSSNYNVGTSTPPLTAAGANPLRSRSSSKGVLITEGIIRPNTSRFKINTVAVSPRISKEGTFSRLSRRMSSASGVAAESRENFKATSERRRRSNTAHRSKSKSKIMKGISISPSVTRTSNTVSRVPSTAVFSSKRPQDVFAVIMKETLGGEGARSTPNATPTPDDFEYYHLPDVEPGEVITCPSTPASSTATLPRRRSSNIHMGIPSANIFDEIQTLAESLQNELSDYKIQLGKERIRSNELEAKKIELEFINHSFKRQLNKYEHAKESWEVGAMHNRHSLEEVYKEKYELEDRLKEQQETVESLERSKVQLQKQITYLDEEKLQWQQEKVEYDSKLEILQNTLQEEETKRAQVEKRIRELEEQMDCCYRTCETRMAESENMKETYEVKILQLNTQLADLQQKLETVKRELDTQIILMDLVKSEREKRQKEEEEQSKIENYIN